MTRIKQYIKGGEVTLLAAMWNFSMNIKSEQKIVRIQNFHKYIIQHDKSLSAVFKAMSELHSTQQSAEDAGKSRSVIPVSDIAHIDSRTHL